MDLLSQFMKPPVFPARWSLEHWTEALGWAHIVADVAIFCAYTTIPFVIGYFTFRRPDFAFRPLFWLFCAFIFACGTVHMIEVWLFWQPWYELSAVAKVVTAVISWMTVLALVRKAPAIARLPSLNQITAIVESTEDAIVGMNMAGVITSWNPGAERLYGYPASEMIGSPATKFVPDENLGELEEITQALRSDEALDPVQTVRLHKNGSRVNVSLAITPIRDARGRVRGASAIARDITSMKRAEAALVELSEKLEAQALHDPLTGLDNRRGMQQHLDRELARARRDSTPVVAVLIDLDDFKQVNDSLGHAAGDVVLCGAAQRMARCLRPGDILSRIGGDEFIALLPDTREAEGHHVAERLRLAVSDNPVSVGGRPLKLSASLGVATVPEESMSIEELLDLSRHGLSRSKHAGKNRVAFSHGGADEAALDDMDTLLRPESLSVLWQPIIDLDSGLVEAHELLVRGPEGPYHNPYDLFRLAIERNLLTTADLLCFKTCVQRAAGCSDGRLHVNIFPGTLLDTPARRLIEHFEAAGGASRFCIEISEQQFLGDPSSLCAPIAELKAAGVSIALDDVGFGRSSLEALLVLEPDVIKIDRAFVHGAGRDPGARRRLERLVRTARHLSAEIVAEGLENASDREVLLELGVRHAQGFLLGRPVPVPVPVPAPQPQA
ncbi:MAG: hypothetical protein DHS20C15_27290 [Planctomycetota bacterium]|nr:MAG: hypothetical protein DHS20C15_27290 [Planctomycetota bacterium]